MAETFAPRLGVRSCFVQECLDGIFVVRLDSVERHQVHHDRFRCEVGWLTMPMIGFAKGDLLELRIALAVYVLMSSSEVRAY